MKSSTVSNQLVHLNINAEVYAYLQQMAREESRSLSGEINYLLRKYTKEYYKENYNIDILKRDAI